MNTSQVENLVCWFCNSVVCKETYFYPDGTTTTTNEDKVDIYMLEDLSTGELKSTPVCKRCSNTIKEIVFQELQYYRSGVSKRLTAQDEEIDKLMNIVASLIVKDKPKTKRKK